MLTIYLVYSSSLGCSRGAGVFFPYIFYRVYVRRDLARVPDRIAFVNHDSLGNKKRGSFVLAAMSPTPWGVCAQLQADCLLINKQKCFSSLPVSQWGSNSAVISLRGQKRIPWSMLRLTHRCAQVRPAMAQVQRGK